MPVSLNMGQILTVTAESAKDSARANSLNNKLAGVSNDSSDEELMEACKSFESYLVENMIKAMEKTTFKEEKDKSDYEGFFGDMLYQEYAKMITERGEIGLAKQLYESIRHNGNKSLS